MRSSWGIGLALLALAIGSIATPARAQESALYVYYEPLVLMRAPDVADSVAHATFVREASLTLETIEVRPGSMVWTLAIWNRHPSRLAHFDFTVEEAYLLDAFGGRHDGVPPPDVRGEPGARIPFAIRFPRPSLDADALTLVLTAAHGGEHDALPHGGHTWQATVRLDPSRAPLR